MATLANMTLRVARRVATVMFGTATGGSANSLIDIDRILEPTATYNDGMLWILSGPHAGKVVELIASHVGNTLNFPSLGTVLCAQQVETLTVLGSCTLAGNATVIVTAAGMNGTPKTLSVALVLTDNTPTLVATKVRAALAADADVSEFFEIGGAGADVVLTAKRARANDLTMNISIDNGTCTGLTAVPTAANTTAGVAGPRYALAEQGIPYAQLVNAINGAQSEVEISKEVTDPTLVGDGTKLAFTLPTGVSDIWKIEIERPGDTLSRYFKLHWQELNGEIRFENDYAPADGEILHLHHLAFPDDLSAATDAVDDEINVKWLDLQATMNVLIWAKSLYEDDPEYDILTRLQLTNAKLEPLSSVKKTHIRLHSAGMKD